VALLKEGEEGDSHDRFTDGARTVDLLITITLAYVTVPFFQLYRSKVMLYRPSVQSYLETVSLVFIQSLQAKPPIVAVISDDCVLTSVLGINVTMINMLLLFQFIPLSGYLQLINGPCREVIDLSAPQVTP
jgi:hypothetical protein